MKKFTLCMIFVSMLFQIFFGLVQTQNITTDSTDNSTETTPPNSATNMPYNQFSWIYLMNLAILLLTYIFKDQF